MPPDGGYSDALLPRKQETHVGLSNRILLIDTEGAILGALAREIETAGFHVEIVADGGKALERDVLPDRRDDARAEPSEDPGPHPERLRGLDGEGELGPERVLGAERPDARRPEPQEVGAVYLCPLERLTLDPEVVVVYGNPAQLMRLIQAATFSLGARVTGEFGGKVECSEYLIAPYRSGEFRMPHRKMKKAAHEVKPAESTAAARWFGAQGK